MIYNLTLWHRIFILSALWAVFFILSTLVNALAVELGVYYTIFAILTISWVSHVSKALKLIVFGFCTFLCVMVSSFIFTDYNTVVIVLMSIIAQLFYLVLATVSKEL